MTQTLTTALLLAGLALPMTSAEEMQPDGLSSHVSGYFYSSGRSYLGVDIRDVTSERVTALKLKEERGVEITMVDADAPAGKAGLREHDVILEFNNTAVDSEEQLRRLIRETPPGRTVTLGISRDGAPMKISVQLAEHSKVVAQSFPRVAVPAVPRAPDTFRNRMDIPGYAFQIQTYSSILGVQTENLTRQLGEFFGVKDGEGILIRSVEKGSAAEKAGLKAGDVIVRADNEKLTDRSDLNHILRSHRSGGKLNLVVVRDKKEQTIMVTLPDRGSRDNSLLGFDSEGLLASVDDAGALLGDLDLDDELMSVQSQWQEIQPQAEKADLWLPVRPGTDGAIALAIAGLLIEHDWIDSDFVKNWTNGSFLVRDDDGTLLRSGALAEGRNGECFVAWDEGLEAAITYDAKTRAYDRPAISLALRGRFTVAGSNRLRKFVFRRGR